MQTRKKILVGAAGIVAVLLVILVVALTYDLRELEDEAEEYASQLLDREVTIEGAFEPSLSFHPTIRIEGLSVANVDWAQDEYALTADSLAATINLWSVLRGPIVIEELAIQGLTVNVEIRTDGDSNWTIGGEEEADNDADPNDRGSNIGISAIALDSAIVTLRTPDRADDPYNLSVSNLELTDPGGSGVIQGSFDATIESQQLAITTTLATIYDPREIEVGLVGSDASGLGELIGMSLSTGSAIEIHTTIKVDREAESFRIATNDLSMAIGESDISGSVAVELGDVPMITATLSSERLSLGDFTDAVASDADTESAPEESSTDRVFSDQPSAIAGLRSLNVSADVTVAELVTGFTDATNVAVSIDLQDGNLELGPASFDVNGGSAAGTVALNQVGNLATVAIDLRGEDIRMGNPTEAAVVGAQPPWDIAVDLRGSGTTLHEIALTTVGELIVVQGAGRRGPDALGILANDFIAQIFTALNPFAEEDPYTEFECGVLRADIAQGTATLSPMLMRTSKMVIVGNGDIDLATESIDVTFNTKPRDGIGLAAAGLVTPFLKLGGTLTDPSLGVNAAGVAVEGGLAIATGGLSLLGKEILDRFTAETADCTDALAEIGEPPTATGG